MKLTAGEWPDEKAIEAALASIYDFPSDRAREVVRKGLTAAAEASPVIKAGGEARAIVAWLRANAWRSVRRGTGWHAAADAIEREFCKGDKAGRCSGSEATTGW